MEIRQLTAADAAPFQALHLRALRDHPEAFATSFAEERAVPLEEIRRELAAGPPLKVTFGAFQQADLIGMVRLSRGARAKVQHKAMLGGMYVAPEARGQGVGRALLAATLAYAASLEGMEAVTLAVTVGNATARALYQGAGFIPIGIEPRYLKVDGAYFDIEWMMLQRGAW